MFNEISKVRRAARRLVMFSFLFCAFSAALDFAVGQTFADVLADFDQAEVYDNNGQYAQAAQAYQNIILQHAGTEHALTAQERLTRMCVYSSQFQEAQTAYQELVNNYSEQAGIVEAICEVADSHLYLNRPQKALEICRYVLETWPNSEDIMWAQAIIVKAYIQLQDADSAQAAYTNLLNNYSSHTKIPEAIYDIAQVYREPNPQKALELYEYAMSTWPDYSNWGDKNDAMLYRRDLVLLKLDLKDEAGAQAAYESMTALSQDNIVTAEAVTDVADAYLRTGNAQKARELFEYAQNLLSGTGVSEMWNQFNLVKTDISSGNDPNFQSLMSLISGFSQEPDLPAAIFTIAEHYYRQAFVRENAGLGKDAERYFQNSIALWDRAIEELPAYEADIAADSYYFTGEAYRRLGKIEKAVECYKWVVDNQPDNENAANAQFLIGYSYGQLKKNGAISRFDAEDKTRSAYEKVIQNYPDCIEAKAAQSWLKSHIKSN
ncbi:MAG TPA: tetratricopeptide repeat protein [Planctomycetes bacterium]|nr:tetratricopeptide repeat protein [Planctomycetota bacterium]